MILLSLLIAAQPANVPDLPADVPASATLYEVQLLEKPAGQMAAWSTPDGILHVFFQFNDRGRGPKTYSTLSLDASGVPVAEQIVGNDYMKDPVSETLTMAGGVARWKNKSEEGSRRLDAPAFYVSMFGAPLEGALLAQAALRRGGTLPLLPAGEARAQRMLALPQAALVSVTGLG